MSNFVRGNTVSKDPDSDLDYTVDWSKFLALADTDTIATSQWIIPPGLGDHDQTNDATSTTVWLTGGVLGADPYTVVNRITTVGGRTEDQTVYVKIAQH